MGRLATNNHTAINNKRPTHRAKSHRPYVFLARLAPLPLQDQVDCIGDQFNHSTVGTSVSLQ